MPARVAILLTIEILRKPEILAWVAILLAIQILTKARILLRAPILEFLAIEILRDVTHSIPKLLVCMARRQLKKHKKEKENNGHDFMISE